MISNEFNPLVEHQQLQSNAPGFVESLPSLLCEGSSPATHGTADVFVTLSRRLIRLLTISSSLLLLLLLE
jgi:hypothetical protein